MFLCFQQNHSAATQVVSRMASLLGGDRDNKTLECLDFHMAAHFHSHSDRRHIVGFSFLSVHKHSFRSYSRNAIIRLEVKEKA